MVWFSRLEEGLLVMYRHFLMEPLQLQGQFAIALGLDLYLVLAIMQGQLVITLKLEQQEPILVMELMLEPILEVEQAELIEELELSQHSFDSINPKLEPIKELMQALQVLLLVEMVKPIEVAKSEMPIQELVFPKLVELMVLEIAME